VKFLGVRECTFKICILLTSLEGEYGFTLSSTMHVSDPFLTELWWGWRRRAQKSTGSH
jgi:hypothetical protein